MIPRLARSVSMPSRLTERTEGRPRARRSRASLQQPTPGSSQLTMKRSQHALLASGLAALSLAGATLQAAPFTYNAQDLLIGFRGPGSLDYVVDIGNISQFAFGSGIHNITAYTGSELSTVFGGLDGIPFSAFGDVRTTDGI